MEVVNQIGLSVMGWEPRCFASVCARPGAWHYVRSYFPFSDCRELEKFRDPTDSANQTDYTGGFFCAAPWYIGGEIGIDKCMMSLIRLLQ